MLSLDSIVKNYPENLRAFKKNIIREYLQYKILYHIFNSPFSNKLSFIGGTALRIAYDNQRFSEDLDFDNFGLSITDFESLIDFVQKKLTQEGFDIEFKVTNKGAFRADIKFKSILEFYGIAVMETEKLLIQVDTAPHNFVYQAQEHILNKFDVFSIILTTPPDILLSQKIRAFFERKRTLGRDIFDIIFLSSKTKPNYDYLKDKLNIDNSKDLKSRISKFVSTLDIKTLKQDLRYMLFNENSVNQIDTFVEHIDKLNF